MYAVKLQQLKLLKIFTLILSHERKHLIFFCKKKKKKSAGSIRQKHKNEKLTTTADHVVIVWTVDWPTVILAVVQIVPTIYFLQTRKNGVRQQHFCVHVSQNIQIFM